MGGRKELLSLVEMLRPADFHSLGEENVGWLLDEVMAGRPPQPADLQVGGGQNFDLSVLVEHVIQSAHIALVLFHGYQILRERTHNPEDMLKRLGEMIHKLHDDVKVTREMLGKLQKQDDQEE